MTSGLKDLVGLLKGSRDGRLPSAQAFPPLDVETIALDLKLEERGEANGQRNLPATTTQTPDSTELDIEAEVERHVRKQAEEYRSQLDLYDGRIRRALLLTGHQEAIEAAGRTALADFEVSVTDDLNHLELTLAEAEGREREFRDFQSQHQLKRLPHLLTERTQWLLVLLLVLFVLVESVVNGILFAEGSEAGLIGGVTQALLLSLFNVGGAALFGAYGLPQLYHRSVGRKFIGVISVSAYICWVVLLNLTIAHFRDLFIAMNGNVPFDELMAYVTSAPLVLRDMQSWMLAVMGLFFSIFSSIDAFKMHDPYPGYGTVGKRRVDALTTSARSRSECYEELQALRDTALQDMRDIIDGLGNAELDVQLAVEGRTRLHNNFRAFLDHAADSHARLVRRYRDANQRARTEPPPSRFDTRPPRLSQLAIEPLPNLPNLMQGERDIIKQRMRHYIENLNRCFEGALGRYSPVVSLETSVQTSHVTS